MIDRDLHVHTVYCDGKNTPEEMVLSAIERGIKTLGLVTHCYTPFSIYGNLSESNIEQFIKVVKELKVRYKDKIKILCGVEEDYHANTDLSKFDYCLASSHYFFENDKYYAIDDTKKELALAIEEGFSGDAYAMCERYFKQVVEVVKRTDCFFVGHFDLITKFNKESPLFDENNERYITAWKNAVLEIIKLKKPFEVNTGGIARGYKLTPYPSKEMIEFIREKGGSFILSSDAHSQSKIGFEFDKWQKEYNLLG